MYVLLQLSRFSRVRLCATPQMAAHQALPSLGFSRQEHWSGLPFPSPMHESEKWKWSRSVTVRLFMTPWTTAYQAPPSMGFSRQEYWSGLPLPSPSICASIPISQFTPPPPYTPLVSLPLFPSCFFKWLNQTYTPVNSVKELLVTYLHQCLEFSFQVIINQFGVKRHLVVLMCNLLI